MDANIEKRLLQLLDERDIHQVLRRYCRGVDRCDADLITGCYHPDAIDDHGNWLTFGRDAQEAIIQRVKPGKEAAMHFLGNVLIEVEGDAAFAESYLLAFRTSAEGERSFTRTRAIRFVDRFERRNNEWRISERVVVDDWNRVDEIVEKMADTDRFRYGAKDTSDPVYAIRRGRVAREPGAAC
ncbi:MAG: nuclear transport factor 2 family protein [Comamonadaceae bacterium]|nr:MAG: nuclear transport factor 2 family protein [Comamonadaceae bacterium]